MIILSICIGYKGRFAVTDGYISHFTKEFELGRKTLSRL